MKSNEGSRPLNKLLFLLALMGFSLYCRKVFDEDTERRAVNWRISCQMSVAPL